MIRTVPVSNGRLRIRAVVLASLVAILLPFLVGLPVWIIAPKGASSTAGFIGLVLFYSPILSLPLAPIGSLLALRAMTKGFAGPLMAALAGFGLGAILSALFLALTFNMLIDRPGIILEAVLTFGLCGALWGLIYWAGIWAFVPDALHPKEST